MTKTKLCLVVALILSFNAIGCNKINARIQIKEANDLYSQEKYGEALPKYIEARNIDPSFADLTRLIGYCYIGVFKPEDTSAENQKNADRGIEELNRYLKVRPEDMAAREALINLYLNANRTGQAIQYFLEYLKAKPADLDAVKSVATLYAKEGNFAEALNWYEKITLLDSKNPEAHYVYGVVCYEKVAKNPPADVNERIAIIEKGKMALQNAINLNPDYFEANVYMNLLYREHAEVELDATRNAELMAKANEYRNRAVEINKARKAKK